MELQKCMDFTDKKVIHYLGNYILFSTIFSKVIALNLTRKEIGPFFGGWELFDKSHIRVIVAL